MLNRLSPSSRFLLTLAAQIALLTVIAALWCWLPVRPTISWKTSSPQGPAAIYISQNGQSLATVDDSSLALWDVATGRQLVELRDLCSQIPGGLIRPEDPLIRTAWLSPDGQTVLYEARDGWLKLWNAQCHPVPLPLTEHAENLAISLDSRALIVLSSSGPMRWELPSGRACPQFSSQGKWLRCELSQSAGGPFLKAPLDDDPLSIFQMPTQIKTIPPIAGTDLIAVSQNGEVAASWNDAAVRIFDLISRRQRCSIRVLPEEEPFALLNEDGSRLLMALRRDIDKWDWQLWDVASESARRLASVGDGTDPVLSPDGQWLCLRHFPPGETVLSEAGTCRRAISLGDVRWIEFSPDSRTLAGWREANSPTRLAWLDWLFRRKTADDPLLTFWESATGKEIAAFSGPCSYAFFPDGRRFATWRDNTVDVWDIPPRRPWCIEYGLPVVFACLLILGCRLAWRFRREGAPC